MMKPTRHAPSNVPELTSTANGTQASRCAVPRIGIRRPNAATFGQARGPGRPETLCRRQPVITYVVPGLIPSTTVFHSPHLGSEVSSMEIAVPPLKPGASQR